MEHLIKVPLWKHQHKLVDDAMHSFIHGCPDGYGWHYGFSGCGTGKTLASIELMRQVHEKLDGRFVLVLTVKATMKAVWEHDINTLTEGFNVTVLDKGTSKQKAKVLRDLENRIDGEDIKNLPQDLPIEVVVVNYETARLLPLQKHNFDLVIADESQRLSQHNSKISLDLSKALAKTPFKYAMTGTAWSDHLKQVFGQFRFLSPVIYSNKNKHTGSSLFGHWNDFLETYCHVYQRDNINIITGYKNVEQLIATIDPHITRIRTEDVIDLPPLHKVVRTFELPSYLRKSYKSMDKDSVAHLNNIDGTDGVAIAQYELTRRHRLHQLTRGWYVDFDTGRVEVVDRGSDVAIRTTTDLLEEIGGEPTVIFTSYKKDVGLLTEAIQKRYGVRPSWLTGGTDEHMDFVEGKSDILIANLQAGSTGVRLHRAKYIIFYGLSVSTSRTDFLQAIERVHRHGQDSPVTMYTLVAENTVDEDAYKLLTDKQELDEKAQGMLT